MRLAFAHPWLAWLDEVELLSRRTSFPEDPDLTQLRALFSGGVPPSEAMARLRKGETARFEPRHES